MDTKDTNTHPPDTEARAEIQATVARLVEIQRTRKLSDRQMVEEYPDLGSPKTWRQRLVSGILEGLKQDRLLVKMRRLAQVLDGGSPDEVFYPDAPFAREMMGRLTYLERQTNDRRILACLAANGTGKSSFARWAVAQSRSTRAIVRMLPTWRNKPLHICLGIVRSLGGDLETTSPSIAEREVITMLRGQTRTLFLDQAHEGGVQLMHLLRGFVDETPARFVYLAYHTAFRLVLTSSADAHVEAQAFMGRCVKPIFDTYKGGTIERDVAFYLERTAGIKRDTAASISSRCTRALRSGTNLRLLDDAIAAARSASDDDEPEADKIVADVYRLAGIDPQSTPVTREES